MASVSCSWEGNCRSGVTLAMHHGLFCFVVCYCDEFSNFLLAVVLLCCIAIVSTSVRENVYNNSKNVKSCVFCILKKNVKKCTYSFTGHLIHSYRKSVLVSHQHQTSCSEMRTQETMQLRTVCDKRLPECSAMAQNGSRSRSWELNYSDHWAKYVNSFWRIED